MSFTEKQLDDFKDYVRVQESGEFNMFDRRARHMTRMSVDEWAFCITNYTALAEAAKQQEAAA